MRTWFLAPLAAAALSLAACNNSSKPADGLGGSGDTYNVTVTRTSLGIPHITANDFGSMGYGYGYAFAEDNLCVLYDDLLTIRGERAKYLGPDGTYTIPANDSTTDNVTSDFFWKLMATDAVVARLKAAALPELREATAGFAAGFNRYIGEIKSGGHAGRHAACRGAAYLAPISEADMYRRYFRLATLASFAVFELLEGTPAEIPTRGPFLLLPVAYAGLMGGA